MTTTAYLNDRVREGYWKLEAIKVIQSSRNIAIKRKPVNS